jgi:hypothetical protein
MPDVASEGFRRVPNDSDKFGKVQNDSENFGIVRNTSEEKENHTLTVREVARMFETAGAARTERSIINWCQPNKDGVRRLDAYYDPNQRKYFITPESVEAAIQEELARERAREIDAEPQKPDQRQGASTDEADEEVKALRQEIFDLKITNRGKDYFIEQLQKEREAFTEERQRYVEDLMRFNRRVGELELQLKQIEAPSDGQIG